MKNVHFARRGRRALMTAALATGLALSGCSQPEPDDGATATAAAESAAASADASADAASDAADAPGAGSPAMSGVAFVYSMAFRLADDSIADAQDRHVRACDALGRARCRVDGIGYERAGEGPATGHLYLRLDPALARGFAREASDIVRRMDGELTHSSISGEELDSRIDGSQEQSAMLGGDLERIERRLARPGLSSRERAELQQQASRLRGAMREEESARRSDESRLASTPVKLDYVGTSSPAGLDPARPFASAWGASIDSLSTLAAFLLMLAGVLFPWLLVGGAAVIVWRRVRRRWRPATAQTVAESGSA